MFRRTVFHFHAGGLTEVYGRLSLLGRRLFQLAFADPDCAIRVSALAPPDGSRLGAKRDIVIPYGVEDVFPRYSGRPRATHRDPRILFVGAVSEPKGVGVLLEAVTALSSRRISFDVEIVGAFASPQFEVEARERVAAAGLEGCVRFSGVKTGAEKWDAYFRADIFCFPSHYEAEALPLVVLEAAQFCLPVVASRWRGIPAAVRDGETGFLVSPQNPSEFAERLGLLLVDPQRRQAMGQRGRELFLSEFTIGKWYERMEEALASVDAVGKAAPANTFWQRP